MTSPLDTCTARYESGLLTVGNAHIERTWRVLANQTLRAVSLRDKLSNTEWLRDSESAAAQTAPPAMATLDCREETHPVSRPALIATLSFGDTGDAPAPSYQFRVFPDAGAIGVTQQSEKGGAVVPQMIGGETAATGVELSDATKNVAPPNQSETTDDVLALAPQHLRLTQTLFHDQTDVRAELVFENEWLLVTNEAPLDLPGCVFSLENTLTKSGLVFLIAAPLPYARPVKSDYDVRVTPQTRTLALHLDNSGYEIVTLAYSGGVAGRTAALQNYQRQIRPYEPNRDGLLVSNTWGDRNRDGRIRHDFLMEEIEAGARLGVDVIQIDDGWQKGATSNSVDAKTKNGVWEGFHKADPQFWDAHPERFAQGIGPLIDAARTKGMRFGLWFGPDSDADFAHYETDAQMLVRLHREQAVDYFKIDGVKLRSATGEKRLRAFFDQVLRETNGRVVFDGDVTAETRFGYWGAMEIGPLFVENRYTDFHRYWPHQTFRALWKLSRYVDPVRLRMEFLNHARNIEKYVSDPIAPHTYRPDYLFATVMVASPLGWFEVSQLPESYFAECAPLIAAWKLHRDALHGGTIFPIGTLPDGTSWTGFASVAPDRKSAYVLLFRELNDEPRACFTVPLLKSDTEKNAPAIELLAGDGSVTWAGTENGGAQIVARLPDAQRFVWARLSFLPPN